jgi:hypothetical protein
MKFSWLSFISFSYFFHFLPYRMMRYDSYIFLNIFFSSVATFMISGRLHKCTVDFMRMSNIFADCILKYLIKYLHVDITRSNFIPSLPGLDGLMWTYRHKFLSSMINMHIQTDICVFGKNRVIVIKSIKRDIYNERFSSYFPLYEQFWLSS